MLPPRFGYDDVTAAAHVDLDVDQPSGAWHIPAGRFDHPTWGYCWTMGTADGALRFMWYPLVRLVLVQISGPRWVGHQAVNYPLQALQGLSDLRPALLRKAVAAALGVKLDAVPEVETWGAHSVGLGIDIATTNALAAVEAGRGVRFKGQRHLPGDYQGFTADRDCDVQILQTPNGRTVSWGGGILKAYDKSADLLNDQEKGKAPADMLISPEIVRIEANYRPWRLRKAIGQRTLGYLVRPDVGEFLFSKQVARLVMPTEGNATETGEQFAERCMHVLRKAQTDGRKVGRARLTPERARLLYQVATLPKMPAEEVRDFVGVSSAELSRMRKDVHELGLDGIAATEPFTREVGPWLQPWTTVPAMPVPREGETVEQGLIGRMREAA